MGGKKWLKVWISIIIIINIPVIGILNFFIDPIWMFKHSNYFNRIQTTLDEQRSKTYFIKNHKGEYDSILIGSSRTSYYSQNEFKNMKVFNYAFSSNCKVYRYFDFIKNFESINDTKNIIVGLDFIGSRKYKNEDRVLDIKTIKEKINKINNSTIIDYIQKYLTIDSTQYSLGNIKKSIINRKYDAVYDRNNIKYANKLNENDVTKNANNRAKTYYYPRTVKYDKNYISDLKTLKLINSNTNLIIFTTPLSKPFLKYINSHDELKNTYYKWINDLVNVFDKVYFTTYMNDLAINYNKHSKDGDHYYPYVGKEITQFLSGGKLTKDKINIIKNIMVIDKDNVIEKIKIIKSKIE
jgi:hypothetical protein